MGGGKKKVDRDSVIPPRVWMPIMLPDIWVRAMVAWFVAAHIWVRGTCGGRLRVSGSGLLGLAEPGRDGRDDPCGGGWAYGEEMAWEA